MKHLSANIRFSSHPVYRGTSRPDRGSLLLTGVALGVLSLLLGILLFPTTAQAEDTRALDWLLIPVTAANSPRCGRVTEVTIKILGEQAALLTWTTDIPVTDEVNYGQVDRQMTPLMNFTPATQHQMQLGNLLRGTVYQYAIAARDNVTGTFVTAGIPSLRYEQILVTTVDPHTLALSWTTNLPADFHVGLRLAGDTAWLAEYAGSVLQRTHAMQFADLRPEAEYRYLIQSSDSTGYVVNTGERSVTMPENNLALHRPVTGSFTEYHNEPDVQRDSDPLANITDGDDGFFTGMINSGEVNAAAQWATVDLGLAVPVRRVVTVWRKLAYPESFRLYGSVDGEQWEMIDWQINAATGVAGYSRQGDPILTVSTPVAGRRCRYVKVLVMQGDRIRVKHPEWQFVTLAELKVFGAE